MFACRMKEYNFVPQVACGDSRINKNLLCTSKLIVKIHKVQVHNVRFFFLPLCVFECVFFFQNSIIIIISEKTKIIIQVQ